MSKYLGFEPAKNESGYFFISYNSEDAERIGKIINVIRKSYNLPFWYDYGIPFGSKWQTTITKKIKNCNGVLMFLTRGIFEKGEDSYVYIEYELAKNAKKNIYIIIMDEINENMLPDALAVWWTKVNLKQNIIGINMSCDALASEIVRALNSAMIAAEKNPFYDKLESLPKSGFNEEKATLLSDRGKYEELLDYCMQYSEDAVAQFYIGGCYYFGNGIEKDQKKAVEWYTKAAEQGYARAQYKLGWCYEWGDGVEKDLKKTVEWYTKAAEQGDSEAQYILGVYYESGGDGVEKDLKKAVEWYTKAAEQGYARAQYNLGWCYEWGIKVEKDLKKAAEWYVKAAGLGHEEAIERLKIIGKIASNKKI